MFKSVKGYTMFWVMFLQNVYQVFVDNAEMVPRRARRASTGVMVLRRLLEPALSLLRDSGGLVSVIMVVRPGHGDRGLTSRRRPGGMVITSHSNVACRSLCPVIPSPPSLFWLCEVLHSVWAILYWHQCERESLKRGGRLWPGKYISRLFPYTWPVYLFIN